MDTQDLAENSQPASEELEIAAAANQPLPDEVQEESKDAESSESSTEKSETPPPKKGVEKRIDHLVWQRNEAERKEQAAVQRLQQLETEYAALQNRLQPQPDRAQYSSDDQHQYALAAWQQQRAIQEEYARQKEHEYAALQASARDISETRVAAQVQQKIHEASKDYPDFEQVVLDPKLPPLRTLAPNTFQAVMESPQFNHVAYYLAKNPDEAMGIVQLERAGQPHAAFRKLLEIENRFASSPKTSSVPVMPTVSGNAKAAPNLDKMSQKEYERHRRGK